MWPWGHLAVAYLGYAAGRRGRPTDAATLVLAVAALLPDLVDKPLAWYLGVLPNGRSLAHSALVAVILVALVWRYADRRDVGAAFGAGYASHLAADALYPLLGGEFAGLAFLVWPLLPPVEYEATTSVAARFADLARAVAAGTVPPTLAFEVLLAVAAAGLWVRHGSPGLGLAAKLLR